MNNLFELIKQHNDDKVRQFISYFGPLLSPSDLSLLKKKGLPNTIFISPKINQNPNAAIALQYYTLDGTVKVSEGIPDNQIILHWGSLGIQFRSLYDVPTPTEQVKFFTKFQMGMDYPEVVNAERNG